MKPATVVCWQNALDKWIIPNIGNKQLSEVSNGVLGELLVEKMTAAHLLSKYNRGLLTHRKAGSCIGCEC